MVLALVGASCGKKEDNKKAGVIKPEEKVEEKKPEEKKPEEKTPEVAITNNAPVNANKEDKKAEEIKLKEEEKTPVDNSFRVTGDYNNVQVMRSNGYISRSHFLIIFNVDKKSDSIKVTDAKINGITISENGFSFYLGQANQYLSGVISEDSIKKFTFAGEDFNDDAKQKAELKKKNILTNFKGDPFYYIEDYNLDLTEKNRVFDFDFTLDLNDFKTNYKIKI